MNLKNNKLLKNKWMTILLSIIMYFVFLLILPRVTGWITIISSIGVLVYLFTKKKSLKGIVKGLITIGLACLVLFGAVLTTMSPESIEQNRLATEKAKIEKQQKADEQAKIDAEEQAKAEADKKAAEEQAKAEADKKAAEEQAKAEADKKAAEEQAKAEADKKAAEEQAKAEADKKAAEAEADRASSISSNSSSSSSNQSGSTNASNNNTQNTAPSQPVQNTEVVYWLNTKSSYSYHKNRNCQYIRNKAVSQGSIQDAANHGHADPCDKCAY